MIIMQDVGQDYTRIEKSYDASSDTLLLDFGIDEDYEVERLDKKISIRRGARSGKILGIEIANYLQRYVYSGPARGRQSDGSLYPRRQETFFRELDTLGIIDDLIAKLYPGQIDMSHWTASQLNEWVYKQFILLLCTRGMQSNYAKMILARMTGKSYHTIGHKLCWRHSIITNGKSMNRGCQIFRGMPEPSDADIQKLIIEHYPTKPPWAAERPVKRDPNINSEYARLYFVKGHNSRTAKRILAGLLELSPNTINGIIQQQMSIKEIYDPNLFKGLKSRFLKDRKTNKYLGI